MLDLAVDRRGYPVPYFVAYVNGEPDHRIMDTRKLGPALQKHLCWLCGKPLGDGLLTFTIGPMCAISRVIAEPPSHRDCALFAVSGACPFLCRPRAKRRDINMPEEATEPAGDFLKRNPGATCLWTTASCRVTAMPTGGVLVDIGEPVFTDWFAEGRRATRAEVEASVESGLSLLKPAAGVPDDDAFKAGVRERMVALSAMLDATRWPA